MNGDLRTRLGDASDRAARQVPAHARGAARTAAVATCAQHQQRVRRRVDDQPRVEAARLVARARRLAPRGPPRPRASRPAASTSGRRCCWSARRARVPPTADGDPALRGTDVVLDVERMRRAAARPLAPRDHRPGRRRHPRRHPLPQPVRSRVFDEVGRWLSAYVEQLSVPRLGHPLGSGTWIPSPDSPSAASRSAPSRCSPRSLAARLFLLNPRTNPQLPFVTRLFGSREIALGGLTLAASGAARRQLVQVGVAVDGADAVTGLIGTVNGSVSKPAGAADDPRRRRRRRHRGDGAAGGLSRTARQWRTTKETIATTPTTTMTARSTRGGSRRPTVAPSWPPMTEPTAISPATGQSTCATNDEDDGGDAVDEQGQHVLGGVVALHACRPRRCPGSPSAAPPGRRRSSRRTRPCRSTAGHTQHRAVLGQAAALLAPRAATRREMRGPRMTSTQPSTISTGTIASNAAEGSPRSSSAPAIPPTSEALPSRSSRPRWPGELGAVADGAGERPGRQPDGVGHVGGDRRDAERQQGRERDQRARPDHGVDGPGGHAREQEGRATSHGSRSGGLPLRSASTARCRRGARRSRGTAARRRRPCAAPVAAGSAAPRRRRSPSAPPRGAGQLPVGLGALGRLGVGVDAHLGCRRRLRDAGDLVDRGRRAPRAPW